MTPRGQGDRPSILFRSQNGSETARISPRGAVVHHGFSLAGWDRIIRTRDRRHVSAEPTIGGIMRDHTSFGAPSSCGNRLDNGYMGTNRACGRCTSTPVPASGSVRDYLSNTGVIVKKLIGIDRIWS